MSNIQTMQAIADTLLAGVKVAAETFLSQAAAHPIVDGADKVRGYFDLLFTISNRYNIVSNIIATAKKENREITRDEMNIAQSFYDESSNNIAADQKS